MEPEADASSRPGRKLDRSRDRELLRCTLDVLAEAGYDGTTIDLVAARAKTARATVYRRWPTKAELVVEAVRQSESPTVDDAPDTGTLAGDFAALTSQEARADNGRMMRVVAGLLPNLADNPALAAAVRDQMIGPRIAVMRRVLEQARERGEIAADRNLDLLAMVYPALVSFQALMLQGGVEASFIDEILEQVLLPAAGAGQALP